MNKKFKITEDKIKGVNVFYLKLFTQRNLREMNNMIKQIAWNTFKKTGNIDTFLELKQIGDIEESIKAEKYEVIKGEGINNSRENSSRL